MNGRRKMRTRDWIYSSMYVAVGLLSVLTAEGLAMLVVTECWPLVLVVPILIASPVLFEKVFKELIDWVFPRNATSPRGPDSNGDTPVVRLLSLPFGVALGVVFALLGWTDAVFW